MEEDRYPWRPWWERLPEKDQDKTVTGNKYCQGSVRRIVETIDRIGDFPLDIYPPSTVREKSRTPPVVTKGRMGDSSTDQYKPSARGVREKSKTPPVVTKGRMGDSSTDQYKPSARGVREKSRTPPVATKGRMGDSSTDQYKPSARGVREKSRTPPVATKDIIGDSSPELYQPSGVRETSRTSPAVTEILRSGRSRVENQFITESGTRTVPSQQNHGDFVSTEPVCSGKPPPVIQSSKTPLTTKNAPLMTQGKAIPLCLPNNLSWDPITGEIRKTEDTRHFLYPVPAAINVLKTIKEPVCVVSIVGPCRDGKSYVLGEVFGQTNVFSIGHIADPETMGLWMWIVHKKFQDSRGRDFRVILLDSEGINAVTAEGQNDNQIFTLTVLLASVLIYNSKGVPKRNDLNDLNYIVKLSQRIRIRSKDAHGDLDHQFQNTFPFFIWLLRDVTQKLPSDCRDYNQFFSTRVFEESANAGQQTVSIESILNLFSGFEAFALPLPSSDNDVMQDISNSREKLEPKFLEGLKRFESLLKSKLAPKPSINKGEKITGEALGALVKLYTAAINDPDKVPNVEMTWDTYVKTKCSEVKKGALKIYDQAMTQLMSSRLPCEVDEILKNHEISQRQSMETFEAETAELTSTNIDRELYELMESTDKKVKRWKNKNASLTRQYSEELLRGLKATHLDPVLKRVSNGYDTSVSYADITNGWDNMVDLFHRKAVGAKHVKADVFFKFNQKLQKEVMEYQEILRKMKDYREDLARERMAAAYQEKEKMRLQEEIAQIGKKEEACGRRMRMLERRQREEVEATREKAKAEKQAMSKNMQMMKEAGMDSQRQFRQQVSAAAERKRQTNQGLNDMLYDYEFERDKVQNQNRDFDEKMYMFSQKSMQAQSQIERQINSYAERERQNIDTLRNLTQQRDNERRHELASLRNQKESLQAQLDEANKPGFFRSIWKSIW